MDFKPSIALWELTMGCNMRCKHCGSSCTDKLSGELNTEESLKLCNELKDLGVEYITLSGGEPTIRKDCFKIAEKLISNGIHTNIVSNGWLVNEDMIKKAINIGINNFAISLDGMKETHDYMRRDGSFDRVMESLDLMKALGLKASIITTINKKNFKELNDIKEVLIDKGVYSWQLQYAIPMGSFHSKKDEMMITPELVDEIIDFAHKNYNDGLHIFLGDNIGYYNLKEIEVKDAVASKHGNSPFWQGCSAGKSSFAIHHNGDIVGCNTVREDRFKEGNIRDIPLKKIWENGFKWNREFLKADLKGFCNSCTYGDICLGGCSTAKLYIEGDICCENKYCSYRNAVYKEVSKIPNNLSYDDSLQYIKEFIEQENYQPNALYIESILDKYSSCEKRELELLNLLAFSYFKLENYSKSIDVNKRSLEIDELNLHALNGLALSYYRIGEKDKAIRLLKSCIILTNTDFIEPYKDLKNILTYEGMIDELTKLETSLLIKN